MPVTDEEIVVLKANPATAALGEKLEQERKANEHMIPKSRFDEVNAKQKELVDQLAKIEADRVAAERKALEEQGKHKELAEQRAKQLAEMESKLKAEQADAEQLRAMVKTKREALKEKLGDKWLSVYDSAPLTDLEKLERSLKDNQEHPDPHRPGPQKQEKKPVAAMTQAEFNALQNQVLSGAKVELKKE